MPGSDAARTKDQGPCPLAPLVAIMQTIWLRTGDDRWLRLTRFFGKLFLINFAIGVVTGIVQEFQFGMKRSATSSGVPASAYWPSATSKTDAMCVS